MTSEAKQTILYLRDVARGCAEEDMKLTSSALVGIADTLEAELRRCRAETLREATRIAIGMGDVKPAFAADVAFKLRRMADEAEREAEDDE